MKRVVIKIDRLVLKGFRECQGEAIAAGLRDELSRSLADDGALNALASRGRATVVRLDRLNFSSDGQLGRCLGEQLVMNRRTR